MTPRQPEPTAFPTWFVKAIVGTLIGSWLSLGTAIGGGIWWAASISSKVDSIYQLLTTKVDKNSKDIEDIQADIKVLDLKVQNLDKKLEVVLDRGRR